MKFNVGNWVEVTVRREGGETMLTGKVVAADRDTVTVECRRGDETLTFVSSEDTFGYLWLRKLTGRDWQARRRRR